MWPQLRAGLIALAIGFGMMDGCPLPSPDHTPAWEKSFVEPLRSGREVVLKPVAWFGDVFSVTQRFSLYQAPIAKRFRMWIETADSSGTFVLRFRAGDDAYTTDADVIEHARIWGAWDPTDHPPYEYKTWVSWLALRYFAREPGVVIVRVRMERIEIGHGEVTPTGAFAFTETRHRGMTR